MSDNYHDVERHRPAGPFPESSSVTPIPAKSSRPSRARCRRPATTRRAERTCRILVVDDDPCVALITAELLRRAGHEVELASDGEAGWTALTRQPFDLLITDHLMPRLSGMELIWRLHAAGFTLPVIVTSGLTCVEIINPAPDPKPWFDAFLQKPFGPCALLDTVDRILTEEPVPALTGT